jgi:hypothetical protein
MRLIQSAKPKSQQGMSRLPGGTSRLAETFVDPTKTQSSVLNKLHS